MIKTFWLTSFCDTVYTANRTQSQRKSREISVGFTRKQRSRIARREVVHWRQMTTSDAACVCMNWCLTTSRLVKDQSFSFFSLGLGRDRPTDRRVQRLMRPSRAKAASAVWRRSIWIFRDCSQLRCAKSKLKFSIKVVGVRRCVFVSTHLDQYRFST